MARLTSNPPFVRGAPGDRSLEVRFPFDEGAGQLEVLLDGVPLATNQWELVGRRVIVDAAVAVAPTAVVTVRRNTDISRLTDLGNEVYARGPATEVAFGRIFAIAEELAALLADTRESAGQAVLPDTVTDIRIALPTLQRPGGALIFRQGETEHTLALPPPDTVVGLPFVASLKAAYDRAAARTTELTGAGWLAQQTREQGLSPFTPALLAKLNSIQSGAQVNQDLQPEDIYRIIRDNTAWRIFYPRDREFLDQLRTLPFSSYQSRSAVNARIGETVGLTGDWLRDAVVEGFFKQVGATSNLIGAFKAGEARRAMIALDASTPRVVGVVVKDSRTTYDRVVIGTNALLRNQHPLRTSVGASLRTLLAVAGAPTTLGLRLGASNESTPHLLVELDADGAWTVECSLYDDPSQDSRTNIRDEVETWARRQVQGTDPATPSIPFDRIALPADLPSTWDDDVTATATAQANARIDAGVQDFAKAGAGKVTGADIGVLGDDNLPATIGRATIGWGQVTGEPSWIDGFDGTYTGLTDVPAGSQVYSRGRVVTDLEGAAGNDRLPFSALRDRGWAQVEGKPGWTSTFDGTYGSLSDGIPLTRENVSAALSGAGSGTFPIDRTTGMLPYGRLSATPRVDGDLNDADTATRAAAVRDLLGGLVGAARLPSTAVAGMLDITTNEVDGDNALRTAQGATSGLRIAIVGSAFTTALVRGVTELAQGDVLIYDTGGSTWERVLTLTSFDTTVNLDRDRDDERITRRVVITNTAGTDAIIPQAISISGRERAGVMIPEDKGYVTRLRSDLQLASEDDVEAFQGPPTALKSYSGLNPAHLIADLRRPHYMYGDFIASLNVDDDTHLVVPAWDIPVGTVFTGSAQGRFSQAYLDNAVLLPDPGALVYSYFAAFGFHISYLEGGTRKTVNEFTLRAVNVSQLISAFIDGRGAPYHRTAGGARLVMAYDSARPSSFRMWCEGQTASEGHYRVYACLAGAQVADIVRDLQFESVDQNSIGDPDANHKRPVAIPDNREMLLPETDADTAKVVPTLQQVKQLIPDITVNGVAPAGLIRGIDIVTRS